jgi:hypothetical protein
LTVAPILREHDGILVVRDDLFPGGTKARFIPALFDGADELVYASPAEGGAQTALASAAAALGKRATVFVAKRAAPHPRALMAKRLGATVVQVTPGYLTVVQKRARDYCAKYPDARLAPFGMDAPDIAVPALAEAARACAIDEPDEVWCAAGSGTLMRGLALAWPNAKRVSVQVGRKLSEEDVAGADIEVADLKFEQAEKRLPPFPSDPHYDAKAWFKCTGRRHKRGARVLFWNVTGPAD